MFSISASNTHPTPVVASKESPPSLAWLRLYPPVTCTMREVERTACQQVIIVFDSRVIDFSVDVPAWVQRVVAEDDPGNHRAHAYPRGGSIRTTKITRSGDGCTGHWTQRKRETAL